MAASSSQRPPAPTQPNPPPHMEWLGNTFSPQRPAKPPSLILYVELDQTHQHKFGKPLRHQPRSTPINAIADSGCQTCTTGLKNPNHQSKILSEAGTLTTLKAKIERLQCLESTEESTNQMRGPPGNQASRSKFARQSAHRRSTRPNPPPNNRNTKPNSPLVRNCRGCGRHSHGNGKSMARRNCPAYSKTCANCGITGHFKAVCSRLENNSKSQANIINEEESVEEHFNTEPYDQSFAFSTTTQNQDFRPSYHIIGRP